jgi:hypothetical protein
LEGSFGLAELIGLIVLCHGWKFLAHCLLIPDANDLQGTLKILDFLLATFCEISGLSDLVVNFKRQHNEPAVNTLKLKRTIQGP